jgi:hypothetical protein
VDSLVEDRLIISGGVVNRTGYYIPQVLFVPACLSDADRSFVVKQFCAFARVLVLDPFSLVTHSCLQQADETLKSP